MTYRVVAYSPGFGPIELTWRAENGGPGAAWTLASATTYILGHTRHCPAGTTHVIFRRPEGSEGQWARARAYETVRDGFVKRTDEANNLRDGSLVLAL